MKDWLGYLGAVTLVSVGALMNARPAPPEPQPEPEVVVAPPAPAPAAVGDNDPSKAPGQGG